MEYKRKSKLAFDSVILIRHCDVMVSGYFLSHGHGVLIPFACLHTNNDTYVMPKLCSNGGYLQCKYKNIIDDFKKNRTIAKSKQKCIDASK